MKGHIYVNSTFVVSCKSGVLDFWPDAYTLQPFDCPGTIWNSVGSTVLWLHLSD
jgi:hypothetical protein